MSKPFKLKYTNGKTSDATAFPFKSPMKDPGHGAPGYHEHTNDPKINMEDYRNQHKFPPNNPGYAVANPFGIGAGGAYGGSGSSLPLKTNNDEWGKKLEKQTAKITKQLKTKTEEEKTKEIPTPRIKK